MSSSATGPHLGRGPVRIIQEAVNNIIKHSEAEHASIHLRQEGKQLEVEITDDGIGYDPAKVSDDHFGLESITKRAQLFGGTAQLESTLGKGTACGSGFPWMAPDKKPHQTSGDGRADQPAINGCGRPSLVAKLSRPSSVGPTQPPYIAATIRASTSTPGKSCDCHHCSASARFQ